MESIKNRQTDLTILIVEDDKSAIEVLRHIISLKFPDITIYVSGNGETGVELCKEHLPEIVITDINLPKMDGIRMAEEIKSMKADTKFIVLTGYNDKIRTDKFSEIGISDYILKPIDFKRLFAAIERCIEEMAGTADVTLGEGNRSGI